MATGFPPPFGYTPQPARRSSRWPLFALLAAVLVVIVGGATVLVLAKDDDSTSSVGGDAEFRPGKVQEPSGDPDAYVDQETGFEITLPDAWVHANVAGNVSNVGDEMFPDDPAKAGIMQRRLGALPHMVVFVAVLGDEVTEAGFTTNITVTTQAVPASEARYDAFVTGVKRGIERIGATRFSDKPFPLLGGKGVRLEYDYTKAAATGVVYAVIVDGSVWGITITSRKSEINSRADELDDIIQSFRVIGGSSG